VHAGGVYNVGTGVETSVNELHAACRRVTGSEREPRYEPARQGDARRSVVDPARAERELGWRAERSLEDGLRLTWDAVKP
jgi:nucleoside-diphosphate-sugar epimerase